MTPTTDPWMIKAEAFHFISGIQPRFMRIKSRMVLCAVLFLTIVFSANAQYKDAGIWTEGTLALEKGKRWEFTAVPELRFEENWSRLARAFVDLGAQYKVNKRMTAGLVFRSGMANSDGFLEWRNRIQLGLGFRFKWNDWSMNYAPRWQVTLAAGGSDDADISTNLRNRFQLKYGGVKDWDFSTSYEFFHSTGQYDFFTWQNWRWTTQASYELNKRRAISAGYLVQRRLLGSPQRMDFVVLVGYKYTMNLKKKEKAPPPQP
jgi:hypothetical protein